MANHKIRTTHPVGAELAEGHGPAIAIAVSVEGVRVRDGVAEHRHLGDGERLVEHKRSKRPKRS